MSMSLLIPSCHKSEVTHTRTHARTHTHKHTHTQTHTEEKVTADEKGQFGSKQIWSCIQDMQYDRSGWVQSTVETIYMRNDITCVS